MSPGGLAAGDEALSLGAAVAPSAAAGPGAHGHARNDLAATALLVVLGPAQPDTLRLL